MKLAFCLFNYFPYGGLQRDFMRIAKACVQRGHEVHVYTMRWDGDVEPAFHIHLVPVKGWQNHSRGRSFVKKLQPMLEQEDFDLVVGFNKMPHLDLYYAADVCYASRVEEERGPMYRMLPRYREWVELEKAVFAKGVATQILLISPRQEAEYVRYYQTESERFHLLPPGIDKDRIAPANAAEIRKAVRDTHGIGEQDLLLLMVGSGFKTKGLDRSLRSLAALPAAMKARSRLFVIGKDNQNAFLPLIDELKIKDQVTFLGGRDDVPHFLLAADLLLHPSYHENTGTVLLEAMAAGLPVLTVEACGYAFYVRDAAAGKVLQAPFAQNEWNALLVAMLESPERKGWGQNGLQFAKHADIYSLPEKAVQLIEMAGQRHVTLLTS
jgi:UDP-glucose:(heptosyl)LPS alpha-1,3-glucosyltransferase